MFSFANSSLILQAFIMVYDYLQNLTIRAEQINSTIIKCIFLTFIFILLENLNTQLIYVSSYRKLLCTVLTNSVAID